MLPSEQWKNDNGKFGFEPQYVVEVATFKLKDGVSESDFSRLDTAVASTHVSKQKGFMTRSAEMTKDNYWRVIVHWENIESAEASMQSFANASAAAEFMQAVDTSTMVMRRYNQY